MEASSVRALEAGSFLPNNAKRTDERNNTNSFCAMVSSSDSQTKETKTGLHEFYCLANWISNICISNLEKQFFHNEDHERIRIKNSAAVDETKGIVSV